MRGTWWTWRRVIALATVVATIGAYAAAMLTLAGMGPAMAQMGTAQPPPSGVDGGEVFRHDGDGLTLELAALSRDQIVAFLTARGFTTSTSVAAARRGCFFRSALANNGAAADSPPVTISLRSWRVTSAAGEVRQPATREDWDAYWRETKIGGPAAVAFHWALFPTEQTFAAADHNWGFVTFMLAPGAQFALDVVWQQGAQQRTKRFERLSCAP